MADQQTTTIKDFDPDEFMKSRGGTATAVANFDPDEFMKDRQSDELVTAKQFPSSTPRLRRSVTEAEPTKFETERAPENQEGFLRHGLGVVGKQIGDIAKSTTAPWRKGLEYYDLARKGGSSVPMSAAAGVLRGLAAASPAGDPIETLDTIQNAPREFKEHLAAGYSPEYSAVVPHIAPVVGVNLPSMEHQADIGNVSGVLSEAAVPAAEAAATQAVRIPKIAKPLSRVRTALAEKAVSPLVYENVGEAGTDLRMGINPESGIVNEGHVGTKESLLAQAEKRTSDLKQAANNILQNHPNANVQINAEPLIDRAIDEAVSKAKKVAGSTERLENLRIALKNEFGPTSGNPFEMNNLKTQIQEAAAGLGAYKNTQPLEAGAASAMKSVAKLIKDEVNHHVPEAKDLNERMSNSLDAQAGLQRHILSEKGKSIFGGHLEGATSRILNRTLGSAPVRSSVARILNTGNIEGVPPPLPPTGPVAAPTPASPFQPPPVGPTPPPAVAPQHRVTPTGTITSTTQVGPRGAGGLRNIQALPEQAESLIPAIQPVVPEQYRTEVPGTSQNEFALGSRGTGGVVVPEIKPAVKGLLPGPAPKGLLPAPATELPPPGTTELAHPELFPRKNPAVPAIGRIERGKGGRMQKVFSGEKTPEVVGRTAEGPIHEEVAPPAKVAQNNAEAPATIRPVLDEAGWQYEGRNNLGQYVIKEPNTNVRIVLFERDLQPDFIKRKIMAKERQYGTPWPTEK